MADVIPIGDRAGSHLATIEIWRDPAGFITAKVISVPAHFEQPPSTADGLRQLADWTHQVADVFQRAATVNVEKPT